MSLHEPEPLSESKISELVKRVIENPEQYPEEAKIILTIETWVRQGPSFTDEQRVTVIYGEADEVTLEQFDYGYPYRKGKKIALIPKTLPTVVLVRRVDDTTSPEIDETILYIFTKNGWKSVKVY
jgi:hypothetical protein